MTTTDRKFSQQFIGASIWVLALVLAAAPLVAEDESGYGFYRTVEGDVRLSTLDRAEPLDVEPNYPLLLGDRVWVTPAGRLEAILPDQTILRAAGGTDLYFQELALYADETGGTGTVLRLLEGEIQVIVSGYAEEGPPLRIDTPNATVYLQEPGVYRIYADDRQWTEVVVREGFGEVALADGSVVVRANEEAVIDGEVDPRVRVYPAGALDALEAWGEDLDREAAELAARESYVPSRLGYQAAPLHRNGTWLSVDAGWAWRPHVSVGWRPYTRGYWTYTPRGRYWVSSFSWGFTFHYGSWALHPHHGWIWHPGNVFSPAWVTWYWGPTYVAWVPSGYYSHYYGPRYGYSGFHFGFHGWAGGSWSYYGHWTFCPTRYFGWRSYGTHWRSGHELGRHARHDVPRGLIVSHTRAIPRDYLGRAEELEAVARELELQQGHGRKLRDVTEFIGREPRLSSEVREVVFSKAPERSIARAEQPMTTRIGRATAPSERSERIDQPAVTRIGRSTAPNRSDRSEEAMPMRPDVSRRQLVTSAPAGREPARREMSSIDSSLRGGPVADSPERDSPSTLRTLPGTATRIDRGEVSMPESPRSGAPGRSIGSVRRPVEPLAGGQLPRHETRVPVVRRVVDGIRGSRPATSAPESTSGAPPSRRLDSPSASVPIRSPSAAAPSRSPSASAPPASVSRSSSSSVRRPSTPPQASRPSSGSSMRGSSRSISKSSSSSSTSSSRSSRGARSQSRSKKKPPDR